MAQRTGDLWPAVSGGASLGAEQIGGIPAGFTGTIRPYRTIHLVSGVWHNRGSSGIIRYTAGDDEPHGGTFPAGNPQGFQFSVDDGVRYDFTLGVARNNQQTTVFSSNRIDPFLIKASGHMYSVAELSNNIESIASAVNINALNGLAGFISATAFNQVTLTSQITDVVARALNGDVKLQGRITSNGVGGQISLAAFATSGQLEYRFGPHQSWYIKTSDSSTSGPFGDGYNPLVPSGNILQMILENGSGGGETLQETYDLGQTIFLDGAQDLQISAGNHKFRLGTDGDKAEISMSGLLSTPAVDAEVGDMSMIVHGQIPLHGGVTTPTTNAEAVALSLGPGVPSVNTGSGIVNVSIGSGISQFFNISAQTLSASPLNVNFPSTGNNIPDQHYASDANDDILVLVPGCYKVSYTANMHKTVGTTRQQADVEMQIDGLTILGSDASCYLRNATNEDKGTANAVFLFDADAGSVVSMVITLTNVPGGETVVTLPRGCNVVIERIGARRGTTTAL